jgi:tRNA (guanine-N7-)-methyltransferase
MVAQAAPQSRSIRSFVLREGRLTKAQERALCELGQRFALEHDARPLDPVRIFARRAPCLLEIGFGNGETLLHLATQHPEWDFLGIEMHRPGIGRLLLNLDKRALTNVRTLRADAVAVVEHRLRDATLDTALIFFPDPWPKRRHHKRRLVQQAFLERLAQRLRSGGQLHMATDDEDYARQMLAVAEQVPQLRNRDGAGRFSNRPELRPITRFEARAQRHGNRVWDLAVERRRDA